MKISVVMFRVAILLMLLLPAGLLYAQQDPVYSQYRNNIQSVNPASTGLQGYPSLTSVYRKQWLNFDGSPTTSSITFSMPWDSMRVSSGFDFIYDYNIPAANMGLFFNYGYQFKVSDRTRMSLGLKAGFNYLEGKLIDLDRYHIDDSYILNFGEFKRFMPNFGVGAYWFGDNFYAGFSVPRILQNPYNKEENLFTTKSREERHYFIHAGYSQRLWPKIVMEPSITTIMVAGAPATADLDLAFHFNQGITFGALYRISDSFGAYANFKVGNLKLGFAYDFTHTPLRRHHNGTFEVLLRFDFRPDFSKDNLPIDEETIDFEIESTEIMDGN